MMTTCRFQLNRFNAFILTSLILNTGLISCIPFQKQSPLLESVFTVENPVICSFDTIRFVNESSNETHCQWYFPGGEPHYSESKKPKVVYVATGNYPVKLVVENRLGEKDSVTQTITVKEGIEEVRIEYENLWICGSRPDLIPLWYVNDQLDDTDYICIDPINSVYRLRVKNEEGCLSPFSNIIVVDWIGSCQK